jgi:hypothetical protein
MCFLSNSNVCYSITPGPASLIANSQQLASSRPVSAYVGLRVDPPMSTNDGRVASYERLRERLQPVASTSQVSVGRGTTRGLRGRGIGRRQAQLQPVLPSATTFLFVLIPFQVGSQRFSHLPLPT